MLVVVIMNFRLPLIFHIHLSLIAMNQPFDLCQLDEVSILWKSANVSESSTF